MDINKPITSTKNNYGLTSLFGGILQLIFGFSLSLVGLGIFAITAGSFIKSRSTESDLPDRILKAKIGLGAAILAAVLYMTTGFVGFLSFLI